MDLETYLERLASTDPTPGGGSAATIVGACAAALVAMIARITRLNGSFSAKHAAADEIVARADELRAAFLVARVEDEAAYGRVVSALALPKTTTSEREKRSHAVQDALAGAASVPLRAAMLALQALDASRSARALGNAQLSSDVLCAAAFARAALEASAANVRINHAYLRDPELVRAQEGELAALERAAAEPL